MTGAPLPRRAVVLDVDAFFRDFQVFVLQGRGFTVRTPPTAADFCAAWVREQDADVIFTEVLLPGKSGLDLTRELRQAPAVRGAIIVYTMLRVKERALAAGADRFLLKPLLRDSYLHALDDATKQTW